MKTYDFLNTPKIDSPIITIGMFDGVHLGHQRLLYELVEQKKVYPSSQSVVVTFSKHPLEILVGKSPPLIMPVEKRLEILKKLGIDICLVLDFTKEISHIPATRFIQDLVERIGMIAVVIGKDFRFGHGGKGDWKLLQQYSTSLSYDCKIVEIYQHSDSKISSTNIRKAIFSGEIQQANTMLGRPFSLIGKVIPGKQLGRVLGFPTANLQLLHNVYPTDGVYAGITEIGRQNYPSLISIGNCPTFEQEELKIEVYLLGFNENLYGQTLETKILEKIREQKKFSSAQELCKQMEQDKEYIRKKNILEKKFA